MDLSEYFIYTNTFSLQFKSIDPNSNQFNYEVGYMWRIWRKSHRRWNWGKITKVRVLTEKKHKSEIDCFGERKNCVNHVEVWGADKPLNRASTLIDEAWCSEIRWWSESRLWSERRWCWERRWWWSERPRLRSGVKNVLQ